MKLYEYMGKEIFRRYGIPVPQGQVAAAPGEAAAAARHLGPCVLKAQVLAGRRGKGGGIKFPASPAEAEGLAAELLGSEVAGAKVEKVLIEEKLAIEQELYLAVTVDTALRCPVVLASAAGGMDIEEVPEEQIVRYALDVHLGLSTYLGREIARRLGLRGKKSQEFAEIAVRLYRIFKDLDAELVEINPLAVTAAGLVAADAKITVDDEALFRHPDLPRVVEGSELEKRAKELDLAFVQLDGDIAVMANGAGITMATLDTVQLYGGRPANFLDAGGGAGVEQTARALEILLATNPKVVFINIFGGITRCDDVARAFAQVKQSREINVPVVIRLSGTNEEEGLRILEACGIGAYSDMQAAARRAVELAGSAVRAAS